MSKNEQNEIEITPEMIEAGVRAMYAYENDDLWTSPESKVSAVYTAMCSYERNRVIWMATECEADGK